MKIKNFKKALITVRTLQDINSIEFSNMMELEVQKVKVSDKDMVFYDLDIYVNGHKKEVLTKFYHYSPSSSSYTDKVINDRNTNDFIAGTHSEYVRYIILNFNKLSLEDKKEYLLDNIEKNGFLVKIIEDVKLQNDFEFIKELVKINPYAVNFLSASLFNENCNFNMIELYHTNKFIFLNVDYIVQQFLIESLDFKSNIYLMYLLYKNIKSHKGV